MYLCRARLYAQLDPAIIRQLFNSTFGPSGDSGSAAGGPIFNDDGAYTGVDMTDEEFERFVSNM